MPSTPPVLRAGRSLQRVASSGISRGVVQLGEGLQHPLVVAAGASGQRAEPLFGVEQQRLGLDQPMQLNQGLSIQQSAQAE